MICPNCKSNIPDDSKFCTDCGTYIATQKEEECSNIFQKSPLYQEMVLVIKEFGDVCDLMEAPIYQLDRENLEYYHDKVQQCRTAMSKLKLIAKKYGVLDEWMERYIYFPPTKEVKTNVNSSQDAEVCTPSFFANRYVLPYWPQRGKELQAIKYDRLMEARIQIVKILKMNISVELISRYRFIDMCIKSVLSISEGLNPDFQEYIQASPKHRNFWENMKARFGDKNYNKFFHYHTGNFAEELYKAMRNMQ